MREREKERERERDDRERESEKKRTVLFVVLCNEWCVVVRVVVS